MALVTSKEIAQVIGLEKFGFVGAFIGWLLIRVLRISAINKIYNKLKLRNISNNNDTTSTSSTSSACFPTTTATTSINSSGSRMF